MLLLKNPNIIYCILKCIQICKIYVQLLSFLFLMSKLPMLSVWSVSFYGYIIIPIWSIFFCMQWHTTLVYDSSNIYCVLLKPHLVVVIHYDYHLLPRTSSLGNKCFTSVHVSFKYLRLWLFLVNNARMDIVTFPSNSVFQL